MQMVFHLRLLVYYYNQSANRTLRELQENYDSQSFRNGKMSKNQFL